MLRLFIEVGETPQAGWEGGRPADPGWGRALPTGVRFAPQRSGGPDSSCPASPGRPRRPAP